MNRDEQERLNALEGCALYRRLAPGKWKEKAVISACYLMMTVITLGVMGVCYALYLVLDVTDESEWKLQVAPVVIAGFLIIETCWAAFQIIKHEKQQNAQRMARLAHLDVDAMFALENEISLAELRYGTFYLLNDYLYAPKARLLLRYTDIVTWNIVKKKSGMTGMAYYAEIRERNRYVQKLRIRRYAEYQADSGNFLRILRERRGGRI